MKKIGRLITSTHDARARNISLLIHLYSYFFEETLFTLISFFLHFQTKILINIFSFRSFFYSQIFVYFYRLSIYISSSHRIFIQLTRTTFQIFKFFNSIIESTNNKHVSRTIKTETSWIFQLIGLFSLSITSN